jgi:hypothetical protein
VVLHVHASADDKDGGGRVKIREVIEMALPNGS